MLAYIRTSRGLVTIISKFNTFISFLIVDPKDRHMTESSANVLFWMHSCTETVQFVFLILLELVFHRMNTACGCHYSTSARKLSFFCHYASNNRHVPSNSTRYVIDASLSVIANALCFYQPLPIFLVHPASSRRTNFLLSVSSHC